MCILTPQLELAIADAKQFCEWDPNPTTRAEAEALEDSQQQQEQIIQKFLADKHQQAVAAEAALMRREEKVALYDRALRAKQQRVMGGPDEYNMFGDDIYLHHQYINIHSKREQLAFLQNLKVTKYDYIALRKRALWGGKRKKRRKSRKRRVKKKTKSKKRKSKKRRRKRRKTRRKK